MPDESQSYSAAVPINRTALQAIYHAVTGKTENITKILRRNVLVQHSDFQQLYYRLNQQIHHYQVITEPSVNIVVKKGNHESVLYSSWERFSEFEINSRDITSEVSIKLELLLKLPLTESPQRCSVSVSLDSGLPVLAGQSERTSGPLFEFMLFFSADKWKTVEISVDFVDFLMAKVLIGVVEEWFAALDNVPTKFLAAFLARNSQTIHLIVNQFGRLGLAIFLSSYVWFNKGSIGDQGRFVYSLSIALFWWSFFTIITSYFRRRFSFRLSTSLLPSVILFTAGDMKAYTIAREGMLSLYRTALGLVWISIANILINIASSYLYTYLTLK